METIASVYLSTTDEESTALQPVADDMKGCEGLNWKKLPSSAWLRLGAVVISLAILSISSSALALQRGNQGAQVTALQQNLAVAGFYSGPVTGVYGPLTQTSVRRFQQARGLQVDGIAGPNTLSALRGVSSGSVSTGVVLQRGDRSSAVTQLQNRLKAAGFFNGPITGYYGQLTQTAVRRFQQARGLRVDGIAGPSTLSALGGISGGGSSPPSSTALRRGNSGSAVTQLQSRMRTVGVYRGPITGFYGELTEAAVRNFQRSRGLTVNGVADASTLSALQAAAPGSGNVTTATQLRSGSSGSAVTRLQTRLRDLGYYNGAITGTYGPLTETAVRDFQRSRGLSVNGIAGQTTLAALQISPRGSGSTAIASLQRGNRGPRVRSLQNRLIGLGYYTGPKDGVFGPSTETALRRYQQDRGLIANGIADASTFASLAPRA